MVSKHGHPTPRLFLAGTATTRTVCGFRFPTGRNLFLPVGPTFPLLSPCDTQRPDKAVRASPIYHQVFNNTPNARSLRATTRARHTQALPSHSLSLAPSFAFVSLSRFRQAFTCLKNFFSHFCRGKPYPDLLQGGRGERKKGKESRSVGHRSELCTARG